MNDADETREVLTAGYVTDLEPIDVIPPYLRTQAESPYVPLDRNRQETDR
jgi:hypothetical protein